MLRTSNICKTSFKLPRTRQKYSRISTKIKEQLFEQIFFNGKKIKEAAQVLNINYSSAKTILYLKRQQFQKSFKFNIKLSAERCSYKQGAQPIELICTRGGNGKFYSTTQDVKQNAKQQQFNLCNLLNDVQSFRK